MGRKSLKCTVISDTHSAHTNLELDGGDILFHCGDLTYLGQPNEVIPALNWLNDQDYKHKVFIAGNHDFGFEDTGMDTSGGYRKRLFNSGVLQEYYDYINSCDNLHYLCAETKVIEGYKIFGSPYTPEFNGWAFSYGPWIQQESYFTQNPSVTRGDMVDIYDEIPEDVDIVMTHGPGLDILDRNNSFGRMHGDNRLGCRYLRERLDELQDRTPPFTGFDRMYHLFGHIHEQGCKRHYKRAKNCWGRSLVSINAAICGIPYEFHNSSEGMNFYLPRRA